LNRFLNSLEIGAQGQRTLPQEFYLSQEHFRAELSTLFLNRWLCVAHSDDISEPGQFLNLRFGSESILLIRDHQNVLRANFNVCRHRGTQIIESPCGKLGKTIQCPYHAWTYSLDGNLVGVPDEKELEGFCRSEHSLHRAAVHELGGLVWLHAGHHPSDFASEYSETLSRFQPWQIEKLKFGGKREYQVQANWKLILQNYSECYHCAPVHPRLVELSAPTSGGNDLVDGPIMGGYMDLRPQAESMTCTGRRSGPLISGLDTQRQQRVYYYVSFPNMLLSLLPDYVMIHWLTPVTIEQTRIECRWYFPESPVSQREAGFATAIDFWDQTNREDWHVSELTQLGVASSRYTPGPYSNREAMSAALDRYYLQQLQLSHLDGPVA
jgi:glycine betaine catabolism A